MPEQVMMKVEPSVRPGDNFTTGCLPIIGRFCQNVKLQE